MKVPAHQLALATAAAFIASNLAACSTDSEPLYVPSIGTSTCTARFKVPVANILVKTNRYGQPDSLVVTSVSGHTVITVEQGGDPIVTSAVLKAGPNTLKTTNPQAGPGTITVTAQISHEESGVSLCETNVVVTFKPVPGFGPDS